MMFMRIAVLCQDCTHVCSFYSSQHLGEVTVVIPSCRGENPRWKRRAKIQTHVFPFPQGCSPQHSPVPNLSTFFWRYWDKSESGFWARIQLVPNRAKTLCSAREALDQKSGNLVARSSILLRVFSFPTECCV